MIDCEALMRAIESLHGGKVVLTLSSEGIGGGTGLKSTLSWLDEDLSAGMMVPRVSVVGSWPCSHHKDFWACVFDGLYRLDFAIGQTYTQPPIPTE